MSTDTMRLPSPERPWYSLQNTIINFTPSWFSVNMGTGILSILIHNMPHAFTGQQYIAIIFFILNIVLFIFFLVLTITRYILYPWVFSRMLHEPTQSLFCGTFPMGLATIVNAVVLIAVPAYGQWAVDLAWTLWWIDVVLSVMSAFIIPIFMFHVHTHSLDKMTAVWLLPIVPCVVVAASGGTVATVLSPANSLITIFVSYALWGVGMGLSFFVIAMYVHRLLIYKLPAREAIISAFLVLGPIGQGAFGIMELALAGKQVAYTEANFTTVSNAPDILLVLSTLIGLLLWGFGLWWLVHGIVSVVIRVLDGGVPYSIGAWGFIFPLGVYTSATITLSVLIPSAFFSYLSVIFVIALSILYVCVAAGTIYGVYTGTMLVAPCLSDMRANLPKPLPVVSHAEQTPKLTSVDIEIKNINK